LLSLFLALAVATPRTGQVLAGSAFQRFVGIADRDCRSRQLWTITPGDLSWEQEIFEDQLTRDQMKRLASSDRRDKRCAGSEGGLSCPTTETLAAMQRSGLLPGFVRFTCSHVAPTGLEIRKTPAALTTAATVLLHLDLTSFANSTGPRRRAGLYTPADYGLSKVETFKDGWTQVSEPRGGWFMSALLLAGSPRAATICFTDTGGNGASYRATEVLQIQRQADARWTAVQVADRADCQNNPPFEPRAQTTPGGSSGVPTFIPHHTMPPR
jgi:hypothetical protein